MQLLVISAGLGLAGWGHLLVHDMMGAATAWRRVDDQFPPMMQSSAAFAGGLLLFLGALLVLASMVG